MKIKKTVLQPKKNIRFPHGRPKRNAALDERKQQNLFLKMYNLVMFQEFVFGGLF